MSNATYDLDLDHFSDLHKDARGHRPSAEFWNWLRNAPKIEVQKCWDDLCAEANERERLNNEMQAEALELLELTLKKLMERHDFTLPQACNWLDEAHRTCRDWDYLDYKLCVPYGTMRSKFTGEPRKPVGFL